jgi:hypothetical protein
LKKVLIILIIKYKIKKTVYNNNHKNNTLITIFNKLIQKAISLKNKLVRLFILENFSELALLSYQN